MDNQELDPSLEQEVSFNERKSLSGNRILKRVVQSGIWRSHDDDGRLITDPSDRIERVEDLRKIADEENAKTTIDYGKEREIPLASELKDKARTLLEEGLGRLLDHGIVTQAMVDLTSKWVTLEDLEVVDEGTTGQHFVPERDDVFPQGEKRPKIVIPVQLIKNKMNHYQDFAEKMGLKISDEELLNISLESIAMHEWSHGLEKAMSIQAFYNMRQLDDYDKDKDEYDAHLARYNVLSSSVEGVPFLNTSSSEIEGEAFSERFATGFEFADTLYSLPAHGATEAQAQEFVKSLYEQRKSRLSEFDQVRNASGYDNKAFKELCEDVATVARGNNIALNVMQPWRQVGYFAPFSPSEVSAILKNGASKAHDEDSLSSLIAEAKEKRS